VHCIQVSLAGAGQGQSAVMADKQGRVQIGLELAHLLADRGLRDIEILAGKGETQAVPGCLKSS
jgi:hypothetical protein